MLVVCFVGETGNNKLSEKGAFTSCNEIDIKSKSILMKPLFSKMLILFSPFILLSLILVVVDPYNLFHISNLFNDQAKIKCFNRSNAAAPRGNILWKTIEFRREPSPNIILGDSRMLDIKPSVLEKKLGEKVYNLSVPGGNLKTVISMFWMAANATRLKNVFIQVNFNNYNAYFNADLYTPTEKVTKNPLYYFLNWSYIEDAFSIIYYSATKDEKFVDKSYKYMENSWKFSKNLIIRELRDYDYIYPEEFHEDLMKISKYCKNRNINLIFITAPDYYETHTYVKVFKLENQYINFKKDLYILGNYVDLDDHDIFSFKKENYHDHYHIKPELADTIISMIFQKKKLARVDF